MIKNILISLSLLLILSESVSANDKERFLNMINIPRGEFLMGSDAGEEDERPVHKVYLDSYWIGKFEVTMGEYKQFIDEVKIREPKIWDPEVKYDNRYPVVGVSWEDAMQFSRWIGKKRDAIYTLPTEAEWERAAKGGDMRRFPWGDVPPDKDEMKANFVIDEDGYRFTSPAGSFTKWGSPYGAMDMAGNVWEWCLDFYSNTFYKESPYKNPSGPASGKVHSVRGGSWVDYSYYLRTTARNPKYSSSYMNGLVGFRLAAKPKD